MLIIFFNKNFQKNWREFSSTFGIKIDISQKIKSEKAVTQTEPAREINEKFFHYCLKLLKDGALDWRMRVLIILAKCSVNGYGRVTLSLSH